jgi:hypothetical protein
MKSKIFIMLLSGVIFTSCVGSSIPKDIFHDSLSMGKLAAATVKASESDVIQGLLMMDIGSEEDLLRAFNGVIEKANECYEEDITYDQAIQKAFTELLKEKDEEGFVKLFNLAAGETFGTVSSIYVEPIKEQYDALFDIQDLIYTTPKVIYTDDVKKIWAYTIINYDITMLVTRSETSAGYFWEFGVEE